MRTSLVLASLLLAIFAGSMLGSHQQALSPVPTQGEAGSPAAALATGTNAEAAKVVCKPGYEPPLCLAKETNHTENLISQESGARPAVAKDTMPDDNGLHKAAYVNDGLYGPGASWVSESAYSWIKIDLGKATAINTVTFGRDRLGYTQDHNPGQFVIAVAMSDNVYADGNSSYDYVEYTQVYDSKVSGFSGVVPGSATVRVQFKPTMARFLKITFVNQGTAVDEVEAFMVQPSVAVEHPTRKPKQDDLPVIVMTTQPTGTLLLVLPTDTFVPPTNTPLPTNTPVPPTDTPRPTNTSIPPTNTPLPTSTSVPPTNTPNPPSDTPNPPTDTPVPPSDTAQPIIPPLIISPTDTPIAPVVP